MAPAVLTTVALLVSACGGANSSTETRPVSRSTVPPTTATLPLPTPTTSPPSPPATTITKVFSNQWPQRTIATVSGEAQDIAPTSNGVYWLANNNAQSVSLTPTTVFRYNPTTGRILKGPSSITGLVGSPALTVTGGWVWIVAGVGDDIVAEQLDPSTLALHAKESLPVRNTLFPPFRPVPNLTATVDGPLWVAGGEDLWALNPATGAVETEFDTGNEIASMSTDPSGNLLYTGGQTTAAGGMSVTQYNAQTGEELERSDQQDAISVGTVAATSGGVWVSYRTGMLGSSLELSANGLRLIFPPPDVDPCSHTKYCDIMGVWASVSDGTVWLTNLGPNNSGTLTCADSTTGAVPASEETGVAVVGPIASGQLLYAVTLSGGVVVITPPAACFG
jgi:hypothetical protein